MTEANDRPIRALLARTGGGPQAGAPGVVVGDQGVGKTALLVHAALDALAAGQRVLHVSLTDSVDSVRTWYDVVGRQIQVRAHGGAPDEVSVERRRMILSYAERPFSTEHLGAQLHMLQDVAQFRADLLVIDGLDSATFLTHGAALCALSGSLGTPAWFSVGSEEAVVRSVGTARFVVRLVDDGGRVRLHLLEDGVDHELPWQLDPTTHLLGAVAEASAGEPMVPAAAACTVYSGGAPGAEQAFGEAAARHGVREVNFTFEGHKQARVDGSRLLSPQELETGDVSLVYVSRRLHRNYNENGLIRKVLQALWHMVSRSQQVFVIGAIQEDGTVVGGTGWSVELARMWEKDLWVYDQERGGWYHWEDAQWRPGEARIVSTELCGTGTRYLEENGRLAIEALFSAAYGG